MNGQTDGGNEDSKNGKGGPNVAVSLLGAIGLLTALLAAFGAANNGVGRMELNERLFLFIGTILVLVALAAGGISLAVDQKGLDDKLKALLAIGVVVLAFGLGFASYAAVTHVSGHPAITATVARDKTVGAVVSGVVTVSDIPSSSHLEMRVTAFIEEKKRKGGTRLVPVPIYAAAFGPNGSGDVKQSYQALVPTGTRQLLVRAWTGSPGPCYNDRIPRGKSEAKVPHNMGCVRVRLTDASRP